MATVAAQSAHKPAQRAAPKAEPRHNAATAVPVITAPSLIQRACACGGRCAGCAAKRDELDRIQPKLAVGAANDPLEREADTVAATVMGKGWSPGIVEHADGRAGEVARRQRSPEKSGFTAPVSVQQVIRQPGNPLDADSRSFFETRFGADLSAVRIHQDNLAAQANQEIGARAFTVGNHIALGAGHRDNASASDRSLMAHELTHVLQQSADSHVVHRSLLDWLREEAERRAEAIATRRLQDLANKPVGPSSGFVGGSHCHVNFCQPFADRRFAMADLAWAGPLILAGIARRVNSRVVPLWAMYLAGGAPPRDLTTEFSADFTASPTTAETTKYLLGELLADIEANRAALLGGNTTVTVDFTSRLTNALANIDDPNETIPPQMNFNVPTDIAGNLVGGIGKDQTSHMLGARPSPFNDSRAAEISAQLTLHSDGSITVVPSIEYTVQDTIDLCPGDCGTPAEQVATVPLSRFEATGLTGDVPMTIEFPAPAAELVPFTVPAPVSGTVTASSLNIRAAPSTSARILGGYPRGTVITPLCETTGTVVLGNAIWLQTNLGYVSAQYVTLTGTALLPSC